MGPKGSATSPNRRPNASTTTWASTSATLERDRGNCEHRLRDSPRIGLEVGRLRPMTVDAEASMRAIQDQTIVVEREPKPHWLAVYDTVDIALLWPGAFPVPTSP